ncbi:ID2 family protein [Megaselia abdita]
MKAITVCSTGASVTGIGSNNSGRISRRNHSGSISEVGGENAEMKMYLTKLKDLVPFMPKNRKLSKLQIIQYVIDYICDLQSELETHPAINSFDAAAALNSIGLPMDTDSEIKSHFIGSHRQPLVDRQTPNTILSAAASVHLSHPINTSLLSTSSSSTSTTSSSTSTEKISEHSSRNC